MSVAKILLVIGSTAVLGSITSALDSPCPDLFHYESTDEPGRWSGTITLLSDADLHGVWIRLIFDRKLAELHVGDEFEVVPNESSPEYLIKNRNFLLKSGTPTNIKITVRYDGNEMPKLAGYRLNAEMVCSPENGLQKYFEGDLSNKDFLKSLKSKEKAFDYGLEGCGTVPLSSDNEVKNGKAQNGQWPWQAAIYIRKNNESRYVCEATLVSSEYLLTAAHCVAVAEAEVAVPFRRLTIHLGGHDEGTTQKFGVRKVVLHPAYRSDSLLNDLALLRLDRAVTVNDYVRPVCLKKSFDDDEEGFLVGYGINRDNQIEDLAQARVKIIKEDECYEHLSDLKGLLTDNVFCASYVEDNLLCVGDSGSNLISLSEGPKKVWELKGVVTVGVPLQEKTTCDPSSVVLLANTNNYVTWIQSVISSK